VVPDEWRIAAGMPPRLLLVATRRDTYKYMLLDTVGRGYAQRLGYSHSIVPGGLLVTSKRTSAICGSAALMAAAMSSQISKGTR